MNNQPNNMTPGADRLTVGCELRTDFVRVQSGVAFRLLKAFSNDLYWINAMVNLGDLHKRQAYNLKMRLAK